MQPPQHQPSKELAQEIVEIRALKREMDDNLAKSEEILGLAQSKLSAAQALLKHAADERDKIVKDRAELVKIGRALKIKEQTLVQREDAINLGIPAAAPYPALNGGQKPSPSI